MEIQLPKWLAMELQKDTNRSLQQLIKRILVEYVNEDNGGLRSKIVKEEEEREKERVYKI